MVKEGIIICRVCTVVPTRNKPVLIGCYVDVIEQQTLKPDKIIMIDSSSTDDTVPLAQQSWDSLCILISPSHSIMEAHVIMLLN